MNMIPVQSSNIRSVGWENNQLVVEYNSGTYVYDNVPVDLYESLLVSDSKGRFMNEQIKNKFSYFKK